MESVEKIREILERFYLGETSLEEEKALSGYFSSGEVPDEFLPDRDLFNSLEKQGGKIEVPLNLNKGILSAIGTEERREARTRRISLYSLSGLAAGLLAVIAVYVFFLRNDVTQTAGNLPDTYEDPMEAYQEVKRTLAYVSEKLNVGTGELKHVQELSKTAAQPLQSLSHINKGNREISLLGQLQRVRNIE